MKLLPGISSFVCQETWRENENSQAPQHNAKWHYQDTDKEQILKKLMQILCLKSKPLTNTKTNYLIMEVI